MSVACFLKPSPYFWLKYVIFLSLFQTRPSIWYPAIIFRPCKSFKSSCPTTNIQQAKLVKRPHLYESSKHVSRPFNLILLVKTQSNSRPALPYFRAKWSKDLYPNSDQSASKITPFDTPHTYTVHHLDKALKEARRCALGEQWWAKKQLLITVLLIILIGIGLHLTFFTFPLWVQVI